MTNKKNSEKRKKTIIISTFCVLIAVFIISYGIGLIVVNDSGKTKAANSIEDLSEKSKEVSKANNDLDKADSETNEDNEKLDEENTETNDDNANLDKENTEVNEYNEKSYKGNMKTDENNTNLDKKNDASKKYNKDERYDKNTKQENNNKDSKQKSDDTQSGQQQYKDTDKSKLNTKEIWDIYNEGNRLYKQGSYEKALPKLEMSYKINPDSSLMPWLTYQLGNCYKELNNNTNAKVYFENVIKNYPNSEFVSSAERMIKEMESK